MPLHLDGKSNPGPLSIDWQRVALAHEKRIAELEAALRELTEACISEFSDGEQEPRDSDEASVYAGVPDGQGITFGMLRRARDVLGKPND